MNTPVALHTPLSSADLISLRAGDAVRLSGAVYTARDAAHIKIAAAAAKNAPLPFDFNGALLFYAGPAPARPGKVIGPIAPTTARRMDGWLELTCKLGAAGSIGKGGRSAEAAEICARYKRVYFLSYGGLAALTALCVKSTQTIAYEELGTESIKLLNVENLPLVVGIDTQGTAFENTEIQRYRLV